MMGQGLGRPCHVIPAKAGIHGEYQPFATMDPGLRRGDSEKRASAVATTAIQTSVIPAKAGIHGEGQPFATMDPGLRRGDGENRASAFATAAVQESVIPAKAGIHRAATAQPRGLD